LEVMEALKGRTYWEVLYQWGAISNGIVRFFFSFPSSLLLPGHEINSLLCCALLAMSLHWSKTIGPMIMD
jgi:hypothetical protein